MVGAYTFIFICEIFVRDVGDSAKKYKMAILKSKPSNFGFFVLVP
jgi:hypothetical protein